jgi:hypothetical protein
MRWQQWEVVGTDLAAPPASEITPTDEPMRLQCREVTTVSAGCMLQLDVVLQTVACARGAAKVSFEPAAPTSSPTPSSLSPSLHPPALSLCSCPRIARRSVQATLPLQPPSASQASQPLEHQAAHVAPLAAADASGRDDAAAALAVALARQGRRPELAPGRQAAEVARQHRPFARRALGRAERVCRRRRHAPPRRLALDDVQLHHERSSLLRPIEVQGRLGQLLSLVGSRR